MHCFKTDETLFEDVLPFHAKANPTAQYSLSSTSVLPWEYSNTARKVLQYSQGSTDKQ